MTETKALSFDTLTRLAIEAGLMEPRDTMSNLPAEYAGSICIFAELVAAEVRKKDADKLATLEAQLAAIGAGGVSGPLLGQSYASDWVAIAERLPEPQTPVLLDIGKKYPIRAMWVPKGTLPVGLESDTGFGEYDEGKDEYFCPEGWYEWNQHEECHWAVSEKPLAWMALPELDAARKEATQ